MRNMKRYAKGMITGLVVGAVSAMILNPIDDKKRAQVKRSAGKTYKKIGAMFDNISDMW